MLNKKLNISSFFWCSCLLIISIINAGCASSSLPKQASMSLTDKIIENEVLTYYQNWQGTRYLYGGTTKAGIDCSSLIQHFFKNYHNLSLPRTTEYLVKTGRSVSDLKPGDLIFFKTGHGRSGLHVGIYYKNRQFLQAGSSHGVTLSSLDSSYWKKKYWQTRRILMQG